MRYILFLLILTMSFSTLRAVELIEGTELVFADSATAAALVIKDDDYMQRVSAYDRSASMRTDREVSVAEYKQHLARNVRNWPDSLKTMFEQFARNHHAQLQALQLNLPGKIILIRTTGDEVGGVGVAYTRMNTIVYTDLMLKSAARGALEETFIHEIFHVYSRHNRAMRARFYKIIGFETGPELTLPEAWFERHITNPDAPEMNSYANLPSEEGVLRVAPFIYATQPVYDVSKTGGIFQSLSFVLLRVEEKDGYTVPVMEEDKPLMINAYQTPAFWEMIGRNTNYVIHPEEIMASNFTFLVMGKKGLPNPEILKKMKNLFLEKK